ncbi:hypothetical protein MFUL124B02_02450 [Myxococcus fulvus 124B02]|nr:hypothetical protein MFUL124B02_02450 [Myxococcus fulvus 124B02]
MNRLEDGLHPTELREWAESSLVIVVLIIGQAVVAGGSNYRHIGAFWFPWAGSVMATVMLIGRGVYLLRVRRASTHSRVDTGLLALQRVLWVAAFLCLYFQP